MIVSHLLAISLAFLVDRLVGDPKTWPHPVRWIGSMISFLERHWNKGRYRKWKGAGMLLFILFVVFSTTISLVFFFYRLHHVAGIVFEGLVIATAIAQKSLKDAALEVYHPLENGDLEEARRKLSYIVGRDTEHLGEEEIVRGAVETVAENTSDGVTAPLFWALLGGAPFAMVYRAVNTCDSVVGHLNERYAQFGYASAKLDDLLNWIPSRITGILMMISKKPEHTSYRKAWSILFTDAKRHPSPNSGWGEAAVAAILGIQLGGMNTYKGVISNRARMGVSMVVLTREHIINTIEILGRTTFLFLLVLWIGGMLIDLAFTWLQSSVFI